MDNNQKLSVGQDQFQRVFKPQPKVETISESQLKDIVKGGKYFIFTKESLQNYRRDLFDILRSVPEDQQNDQIKKAKQEFQTIEKYNVELEVGGIAEIFMKAKPSFNDDEEDENISINEDNDEELEDEEDTDMEGDDTDTNDSDNIELSDEEEEILFIVSENLVNNESDEDAEEIADETEPPKTTNEVQQIIDSLVEKGLIEADGGNVTAITDKGQEYINSLSNDENGIDEEQEYEEEDDTEDSSSNDVDNSNEDVEDESEDTSSMEEESVQENENKGDNDEDASQDDIVDENGQEDDANKENEEDNQKIDHSQLPPDQIESFAAQTKTEDLQKYISNPNNPRNLVEAAQAELQKRNAGDKNVDDNNGEENDPFMESGQVNEEEEKEFQDWMNKYLDEHDVEDLREYTKKLIFQSPGKLKELKDHYRSDFSMRNGGNKVDKIDKEQFNEWVDEYLSHFPLGDLKDYTSKLLAKNPKEFKSLKSQFTDLKSNNMLP